MHHNFTLALAIAIGFIGFGSEANAASGRRCGARRANRRLLAVPRIPSCQLHVRDSRISKALALPTLAAQHAVLSLS